MKKRLYSFLFAYLLLLPVSYFAQMVDFDFAANWTMSDINGQSHTLYNYLDQNKSVVLYFFDAANPPSWAYHNTNSLQNLHSQHSDSAVVVYIEGNLQTTNDNIQGVGQGSGATLGNWTSNNPCPILNLEVDSILTHYQITQFPVVITVCPGRLVRASGERTTVQHQELLGHCDSLATDSIDAIISRYYGPTYICNAHFNKAHFRVQNKGFKPLTSATAAIYLPGTSFLLVSMPWTGNLKTYETADIVLPRFDLGFDGPLSVRFLAPGDIITWNNYYYPYPNMPSIPVYDTLMNLQIITDQYGDETTWELIQSNNTVAFKGGPYEKLAAPGTTVHNIPIHLDKDECYTFKMKDKYGDGICCDYGNGSYNLTDASGLIVSQGDTSFIENVARISATGVVGIDQDFKGTAIKLYPVPASATLTVEILSTIANNMQAEITNVLGQTIKTTTIDAAKTDIDIRQLPAGTYNLQLKEKDNSYNFKFIKVD